MKKYIKSYPDGSTYVDLDHTFDPDINHVVKLNSYKDVWQLNQFVDAFISKYKKRPTIIIPSLLDSQADRRFKISQSAGLKLLANFLNKIKASYKIFHPHNAAVVEALIDNVTIVNNTAFVKSVFDSLNIYDKVVDGQRSGISNTVLMSADAGGFKPLMELCDEIGWGGEISSASKHRKYENGDTILTQILPKSDYKGKDIIVIDDLAIYGGTFKGLASKLRECNVGNLYLVVSHITVQHLGTDPVTNYFDKVFTTNSKFDSYTAGLLKEQPDKLEIIKLF